MTNDNDNNDANSDEKLYLAKSINFVYFRNLHNLQNSN